jgi:4-amino-4-deoxy-L-arabinose transferase-like glycosyltransferase
VDPGVPGPALGDSGLAPPCAPRRAILPLAWWLMVVLFFSIPAGKRDVYILPALPMFCLVLAPLLPGLLEATRCAGRGGAVHRPAVTGPGRGWRDGGAG